MEFQDPSWHVDEVFAALAGAGRGARARPSCPRTSEPPTIRRTGPFLYLRLRRDDYTTRRARGVGGRLEPFLADGLDAFVYFRHDEAGRGAELALELAALARSRAAPPASSSRRAARALGGSERDEQRQVLGDVVEAVRDAGRHEHDRAGPDVADLVADRDPAAAGDDVVDLVLGVRLLEVRLAGREDVEPDATGPAP